MTWFRYKQIDNNNSLIEYIETMPLPRAAKIDMTTLIGPYYKWSNTELHRFCHLIAQITGQTPGPSDYNEDGVMEPYYATGLLDMVGDVFQRRNNFEIYEILGILIKEEIINPMDVNEILSNYGIQIQYDRDEGFFAFIRYSESEEIEEKVKDGIKELHANAQSYFAKAMEAAESGDYENTTFNSAKALESTIKGILVNHGIPIKQIGKTLPKIIKQPCFRSVVPLSEVCYDIIEKKIYRERNEHGGHGDISEPIIDKQGASEILRLAQAMALHMYDVSRKNV